jgi:hypothetical protein
MAESEEDRIAELASRLEALFGTPEFDTELWRLSREDRNAVAALQEQRAAHHGEQGEAALEEADFFRRMAETDLLEALDDGNMIIRELERASQPAGLFAMVARLIRDEPQRAESALFAAIMLEATDYRDPPAAPAVLELLNEWYAKPPEKRHDAQADQEGDA